MLVVVLDAVLVVVLAKRVVVVIKVKKAGLVGFIRWVSRVVKCPCNDASLKEVLNL
ncbi:50S ribosomal protein L15 [Neisseria meningitidis NM576]|nr:50S ribosomal protein L15 [Neisseria meningitidis NM183]EJU61807.1 50S ribosomal protein L15 [Neisseria meningitidis NM140]EJU63099.1 50S ribosomal protein L15 [Neisseria meningitidis NM2781]EJU68136.1 50S ribosomal protein L15 [Neisseria meningitidis NM576]EJU75686.1 putative 50S ribosomal protein L15 [Neisseria meningitidis NM2657]